GLGRSRDPDVGDQRRRRPFRPFPPLASHLRPRRPLAVGRGSGRFPVPLVPVTARRAGAGAAFPPSSTGPAPRDRSPVRSSPCPLPAASPSLGGAPPATGVAPSWSSWAGSATAARSTRSSSSRRTAPALSSGKLPLPHFGDCTQEGQPLSQGQSRTVSRVAVGWGGGSFG